MSGSLYEIWVDEPLDSRWSHWFEKMEIVPDRQGGTEAGTRLRGYLADQAALFGVLSQIRNLNLTLVEVRRINSPEI